MIVEETFYRPAEIAREARTLPAGVYNLAHTLLARTSGGCLFVPIRAMQFLAVIDRDEIIFVDREGRRLIEVAWQRFRPGVRHALDEPVGYETVYYSDRSREIMKRLQAEFSKALRDLQDRTTPSASARILPLHRDEP